MTVRDIVIKNKPLGYTDSLRQLSIKYRSTPFCDICVSYSTFENQLKSILFLKYMKSGTTIMLSIQMQKNVHLTEYLHDIR